ncbi:hypothetical protein BH11PSE11_BH11PSE11_01680 [soil metagenome]
MHTIQTTLDSLHYGGAVVYPLLALALLALLICFDKAYVHLRYMRLQASLADLVARRDFSWAELERSLRQLGPQNYFGRFFRGVLENRTQPAWWVESHASDDAHHIQQSLGRGMWVLETIVTAAPLLGLLGTIDGMMDSFKLIGSSGLADPASITGGVAQALIATALGLLIALLALFAFNFFSARQSGAMDEMERLGTRLIDRIRFDQQVHGGLREAA